MLERTFVMIKPDAVERNLADEIISRIEQKGLKVSAQKDVSIALSQAEKLYEEHKEKSFYPGLVKYIMSGKVKVMEVRGENAVQVMRDLMGDTYPEKAKPGTIRADFMIKNIDKTVVKNTIHGSDSVKSAERELKIFF